MPQKPGLIINSQNISISLQPVVFRRGKDSPFEHIVDFIRDMPLDGAEDMIADTISLILSSPEKSLDAFARLIGIVQNYRKRHGYYPHCPECGGRMVADGRGKSKKLSSKVFLCKKCGKKRTFSMTIEGMLFLMAKSISLSLPYLFGAPARELARLGLIRMSIIEHLDVSQNMISIDTSRYDIEIPDDILVVWMDTTFSMKYKVMCLVSRERVIFRVVNEEDAASALDMLRMVVMGGHSGKIVLLTDGGNAFYSAVRQLPPDEQKRIIHVRQFHWHQGDCCGELLGRG